MPRYHTLGKIPPKRHTIFKDDNDNFYYEELFGTIGFEGMSSLMYHTQRPTQVKKILKSYDVAPKIAVSKNMKSLKLEGFKTVLRWLRSQVLRGRNQRGILKPS